MSLLDKTDMPPSDLLKLIVIFNLDILFSFRKYVHLTKQ